MTAVVVRAPAKVNLQLSVAQPRPDGYHELISVFQAVGLYDEVVLTRADLLSVTVEGTVGGVPVDQRNLAAKAALLLAERAGVRRAGVHIHLRKQIPVAGGMAGGSADAAATLLGCDALWGTGLERDDLLALAAQLGSDVPFSLTGGTAVGLGRGEQLTPALARGRFHWVFATSDEGLSTPTVFAELDRLRGRKILPQPAVSEHLMSALRSGDPVMLGRALTNDLQDAACSLRPSLRDVLTAGADAGALGGLVSGSGPTCAFLARSAEHAIDLAVLLSASGTCSGVLRASGPVHGARVVEGSSTP